MRISILAVALAAAAVIIIAAKGGKQDNTGSGDPIEQTVIALAPVSPVKTVTSATCASDGCPVSCESGDTLLSAICVTGTKGRFADTLRVEKGALTASCSTSAGNILVYCGRP